MHKGIEVSAKSVREASLWPRKGVQAPDGSIGSHQYAAAILPLAREHRVTSLFFWPDSCALCSCVLKGNSVPV